MKILIEHNQISLIDPETGEVTETSNCKSIIRILQELKKAKHPENIESWFYHILHNSILSAQINDFKDFQQKALEVYPKVKKRWENALKIDLEKSEKEKTELKNQLARTKNKNEKAKLERKIRELSSYINSYPTRLKSLQNLQKIISNCPELHRVKIENTAKQIAIFEVKKMML